MLGLRVLTQAFEEKETSTSSRTRRGAIPRFRGRDRRPEPAPVKGALRLGSTSSVPPPLAPVLPPSTLGASQAPVLREDAQGYSAGFPFSRPGILGGWGPSRPDSNPLSVFP